MTHTKLQKLQDDDLLQLQSHLLEAQEILQPAFVEACADIKANDYGTTYNQFTTPRHQSLTGVIISYTGIVANLLEIEKIRKARETAQTLLGSDPQP